MSINQTNWGLSFMVPGIGIASAGLVMFFLLAPAPEAAGFQPEQVWDEFWRKKKGQRKITTKYPCALLMLGFKFNSYINSTSTIYILIISWPQYHMCRTSSLRMLSPNLTFSVYMTMFFDRTRSLQQMAKKKRRKQKRRKRKQSVFLEPWRFQAWSNSHFGKTLTISQPIVTYNFNFDFSISVFHSLHFSTKPDIQN